MSLNEWGLFPEKEFGFSKQVCLSRSQASRAVVDSYDNQKSEIKIQSIMGSSSFIIRTFSNNSNPSIPDAVLPFNTPGCFFKKE